VQFQVARKQSDTAYIKMFASLNVHENRKIVEGTRTLFLAKICPPHSFQLQRSQKLLFTKPFMKGDSQKFRLANIFTFTVWYSADLLVNICIVIKFVFQLMEMSKVLPISVCCFNFLVPEKPRIKVVLRF
jgi:hypothetical protein